MQHQKPKLYYFELYGRAEVIRLAFYYAKEEFEDIQLSKEKFAELKNAGEFPLGQVPVLEFEGKKLSQSICILRFLCKKWGFYPSDPESIYAAEAAIDFKSDIMKGLVKILFTHDPQEKEKASEVYFQNELPGHLKNLERLYKIYTGNTGYFVGKSMTIVDFVYVDMYASLFLHPDRKDISKNTFDEVPEIKKYFETRVQDFKEYLEKRPYRPY